jgi:hypothetical protein
MRSAILIMVAVLLAIALTHHSKAEGARPTPIAALNPTTPLYECWRQFVRGGPWHHTYCSSQDLSHPFSRGRQTARVVVESFDGTYGETCLSSYGGCFQWRLIHE